MAKPPARTIVRFELSPESLGRLRAARKRLRLKQPVLYSRLIEWYAAQPEQIRNALIGWTPHHRKIADLFLQELLQSLKKHKPKDQARSWC
jgi:hypothetical protein